MPKRFIKKWAYRAANPPSWSNSILNEIGESLISDGVVKISSFGTFSVRSKGRRIGRNPKTGEEVPILPRRVLVFRPSQLLKDRINGHGGEIADEEDE